MALKIIIYHLDVLKGDIAEVDEAIFQFVERPPEMNFSILAVQ
jgi:hypothetical protein